MPQRLFPAAFALMLAALLVPSAAAQDLPSRSAFVTYAGLGANFVRLGDLSRRLERADYGAYSNSQFWYGTSGRTFLGPFMLGSEANWLRKEDSDNARFSTSLRGRYSAFHLGYVVRETDRLRAYPLVGLGHGSYTLRFYERGSDPSFGDVLANPARGAELKSQGWLLDLGGGADYLLPLRETEDRQSGLVLGLRAGYLFAPLDSDWALFDEGAPSGTPDLKLAGPYFRLTVGLGWFDK